MAAAITRFGVKSVLRADICQIKSHGMLPSRRPAFQDGKRDFLLRRRSETSQKRFFLERNPFKVSVEPSNKNKGDDDKLSDLGDRMKVFLGKMSKLSDQLSEGKIGIQEFLQLIIDMITDEFPDLSPSSYSWYDVDGNRMENLSQEQLAIIMQGRYFLKRGSTKPKAIDWNVERQLVEKVFNNGPFDISSSSEEVEGWIIFQGEVIGDPEEAYAIITERLKKHMPDMFVTFNYDVLIGTQCIVGFRESFATTPEVDPVLFYLFLAYGFISTAHVLHVDLDILTPGSALWNGLLLPAGVLLVLLSNFIGQAACSILYGVPVTKQYLPFPIPNFGFTTLSWNSVGYLPNRACLIDQALAGSLLSCLTSLALLASNTPQIPFYIRLLANDFGWHEMAGSLTNVTLVSPETFAHSAVLSELLAKVSTGALTQPDGSSLVAIGPLGIAGLMGLHMTACSLLPVGTLNGGRIVGGVGGLSSNYICSFLTWIGLAALSFSEPGIVWPWALLIPIFGGYYPDERRRNEITPPGLVRSMVGLAAVGMGVFLLLPSDLFLFIFKTSPVEFVEQLWSAISTVR